MSIIELPKIGLAGKFRLVKSNVAGETTQDTGWFDNLIVNNGLDLCATQTDARSGYLRGIGVGSGNTAPTVSDAGLQMAVAWQDGSLSGDLTQQANATYAQFTRIVQFGEGAAAGNLSEVVIGRADGNIFARQLIKDTNGNPTTITVLSNEFLTVYYQLRINQPQTDTLVTVNGYDLTIRSALVNSLSIVGNIFGWSAVGPKAYVYPAAGSRVYISTDTIKADLTQSPQLSSSAASKASGITEGSYTPGSYTRTGTLFWGINDNPSNGLDINSIIYSFGWGCFQIGVVPAITKDNTKELTIVNRLTWGREGEV